MAAPLPAPVLLLVLLIPTGALIVTRNAQWKDDTTLFTHDVKVVPNSVLANGNAGRGYLVLSDAETDPPKKRALLETALGYLNTAIHLDPDCVNAYFYLGNAYDRLQDNEKMEAMWNQARQRAPNHPNFRIYDPILANRFANQGLRAAQGGDLETGRRLMEKAVRYAPQDAGLWYRYGRVLLLTPEKAKAKEALQKALQLDPNLSEAKQALEAEAP